MHTNEGNAHEVGVRMTSTEIRQWRGIGAAAAAAAPTGGQQAIEELARVRASDGVHGVELEFEVGEGEELAEEGEIEASLKDIEVVLEEGWEGEGGCGIMVMMTTNSLVV